MKRHVMPDIKEGNVNVTPLIDVVMCLIIFFMLAAKIGVSTGAEPMDLPQSIRGMKIPLGGTLTLNVRPLPGSDLPQVTAMVDGKSGTELKVYDPLANNHPLTGVLSNLRRDNPEFRVIIRGERSMPYRYLEPVLICCAEANVKNVSFNTKEVTVRKE